MKFKGTLFVLLSFFILTSFESIAISDYELLFNESGTQYVTLELDYTNISLFTFNISGGLYNSSYPQNVSVDIANDSINDYEYKVYHSNRTAFADRVVFASTNYSQANNIDFNSNMTNKTDDFDRFGVKLGHISSNVFYPTNDIHNGTLSFYGDSGTVYESIITIYTPNGVIHAAMPTVISPLIFGFYIAEGGSTYYCHSSHDFNAVSNCDLSAEQAMNQSHLAKQADYTEFSSKEYVNNLLSVESINTRLQVCGTPPCNITIKVSTMTAGNITISGITLIGGNTNPANITLIEETNNYNVTIDSDLNLTNVSYAFGVKPNVYVMPVVAYDDNFSLTTNQSMRYTILKGDLKKEWDNLTNNSHPMNFTFLKNPLILYNYSMSENNFSRFLTQSFEQADRQQNTSPNIIIILDVHDYFANESSSNMRTTMNSQGGISYIYINGFSDTNNKTKLYKYNEKLLTNVVIHELVHTFIFYPSFDALFYADHPASFSNLTGFPTYQKTESPTGNEGYFEIHSPLNQIRPYIANENINNTPMMLSTLDKLLLGILSPHTNLNYFFYEGDITYSNARYNSSLFIQIQNESVSNLYTLATADKTFWDVRTRSNSTNMNLSRNFLIPKTNQDNRSLWVYAKDAVNDEHYKVFNNNAESAQNEILANNLEITLNSPLDNNETINRTIIFNCSAVDTTNLVNVTLYENWTANFSANETKILTELSSSQVFTKTLPEGSFGWNCYACNNESQCAFSESNFTIKITDITMPSITYRNTTTTNATVIIDWATSESTNFSMKFGTTLAMTNNRTSGVFSNSWSTYIENLTSNTTYYYNLTVCDSSNNCNTTGIHNFTTNATSLDITPPSVFLISPANTSTQTSSSTVTFSFNVTDNSSISNCSLILNDVVDQTSSSITKSITQQFSKTLANGDHNWKISCYDTNNNQGNSTTNSFTLSYTAPTDTNTNTGGGGGGAGGAGGTIYVVSNTAINEGYIQTLGSGSIFKINLTNNYYLITLSTITASSATIKAETQTLTIGLNEEVITNKNVSVKLLSLTNKNATLKVVLNTRNYEEQQIPQQITTNRSNDKVVNETIQNESLEDKNTINNPDKIETKQETSDENNPTLAKAISLFWKIPALIALNLIVIVSIFLVVKNFFLKKGIKEVTIKNSRLKEMSYEEKLEDYIKKEINIGASMDTIKKNLLSVGWEKTTVEKMMKKYEK